MIGQMRHRVTFLLPATVAAGAGASETTYTDGPTLWAEAKRDTSTRDNIQDQTVQVNRYSFKIRWYPSFTPTDGMIIKYQDYQLTINSIIDTKERTRYWQITATVKV